MFHNETHISTVEDSAQTAVWVSGAQKARILGADPAATQARRPETLAPGLSKPCPGMTAPAHRDRSLGRERRIKYGRDFARIKQHGARLVSGSVILNWLIVPGARNSRLGVVVSKKLGKATVRNRIKRLLREVFRLHNTELAEPVDMILIARPAIVSRSFAEIERDYLDGLAKAGLYKTSTRNEGIGTGT